MPYLLLDDARVGRARLYRDHIRRDTLAAADLDQLDTLLARGWADGLHAALRIPYEFGVALMELAASAPPLILDWYARLDHLHGDAIDAWLSAQHDGAPAGLLDLRFDTDRAAYARTIAAIHELIRAGLIGFAIFMVTHVIHWQQADTVFNSGIRMMSMIAFIMIAANGFAAVMNASGGIEPLVADSVAFFGNSRALVALAMLVVGLLVTMGIGSSFSTLPIIAAIYVPLCAQMGFSPLATVAIIGTAGALGDAGSPASDSTLGPTMGFNADGQHNHIKDTVIPTFLHYNVPLLIAGWIAALVL